VIRKGKKEKASYSKEKKKKQKIMISLLLPILLLSVVVVGGAHAHPSTIRQRTLQDKDEACPTSFEYGSPCDVTTQKGKECGYDFVYVGCGATEEEFECLPEMTCTCDDLSDGTWACPIERRAAMTEELAMANICPENGITVSVKRGDTCTPSPPTSASSSSVTDGADETIENGNDNTFQQQGSDSAGSGNSDMNGGIDLLDPMNATAVDGTTLSASKDTVDNDNGIDSVDVTTPAVVDDNDSSTTTITVKGESEGAMSSLSSSSSQQGRVAVKVAMVAAVTATAAGITLFL